MMSYKIYFGTKELEIIIYNSFNRQILTPTSLISYIVAFYRIDEYHQWCISFL